MKISIIYYTYKMNIKTNLLEEYVNFVDNTKKTKQKLMDIYSYTCIYSDYTYNYNI